MNLRSAALGAMSVAVFSGAAFADLVTVQFKSPYDNTSEIVNINYNGHEYNNVHAATGLYNITVDGVSYQTFCIDPMGDINPNDTWAANHLSATEISAGNGELFTNAYPNRGYAQEKYAMINYLADKSFYLYTTTPDSRLDTRDERSDLSLLYWEIALDYNGNLNSINLANGKFSSTSTSYNSTLQGLVSEAYNHRGDALTMSIYSPTMSPSQEFLAFKTSNVPEPGTILLMLFGLSGLGISGLFRRKK